MSQDLATNALGSAAAHFSYTFPPYSATVLSLVPARPQLAVLASGPGQFAVQLQGQPGVRYYLQHSTNFSSWVTFSTNTLSGSTSTLTNASTGSANFYRALWLP